MKNLPEPTTDSVCYNCHGSILPLAQGENILIVKNEDTKETVYFHKGCVGKKH